MSDNNFDIALAFVFKYEGGYVDNPADPGGATNMGITMPTLSRWRDTSVTKADIKALSQDEAEAIYGALYWNATHAAHLPDGLDLVVFDGAVNLGVSRSAKMLQRVVGTTQDGSIGPLTLTAAKTVNLLMGIEALVTVRSDFYKSLPTFPTFGKGWLDRLAASRAMAMALSGGQITI